MRMAEYQFIYQMIADISNIKLGFLFTNAGIERDMQQDIAQLLADVSDIILHQCIAQLIGLFNRIGT